MLSLSLLDSMQDEASQRQRISKLRSYAFFQLEIHLNSGKDLLAKDNCGTSDPYVKFRIGSKQVYKSRTVPKTLNPTWDEYFIIPIEDVFEPIVLRAFDHDFGFQDDYLGTTKIDLTKLNLNTYVYTFKMFVKSNLRVLFKADGIVIKIE